MVLDEIIGHERTKDRLRAMLNENRVPQAILFVGPSRVGKSLLARSFAQMLQCPDGGCGLCPSCRMVASGSHIDTLHLEDEDDDGLSINVVREMISRLSLTPQSKSKIAIIENIGRMSHEAEGAILKTLEEPTPNTYFLITARTVDDVLPTIRSRVTAISVSMVENDALEKMIEKVGRDLDKNELITLANGRPGQLKRYLNNEDEMEGDMERLRDTMAIIGTKSLLERFEIISNHASDSGSARSFLRLLALVLQKRLLKGNGSAVSNTVSEAIRKVFQAQKELYTNARPRLILEDLVVQLPTLSGD